jgi:hypothetical protein
LARAVHAGERPTAINIGRTGIASPGAVYPRADAVDTDFSRRAARIGIEVVITAVCPLARAMATDRSGLACVVAETGPRQAGLINADLVDGAVPVETAPAGTADAVRAVG